MKTQKTLISSACTSSLIFSEVFVIADFLGLVFRKTFIRQNGKALIIDRSTSFFSIGNK